MISTLAIVLAALYILIMYQRTMTGPVPPEVAGQGHRSEWPGAARHGPAGAADPGLGVFPKPMLAIIEPTDQATMQHVGVTDPPPRVERGGRPLMSALMLLPLEITAPTIDYGLLAPVLIIFAGACLGVLVEALVPRDAAPALCSWSSPLSPSRRPGHHGC